MRRDCQAIHGGAPCPRIYRPAEPAGEQLTPGFLAKCIAVLLVWFIGLALWGAILAAPGAQ